MAGRYRPRKEFKFWLNHDLAEDVRLMGYIEYLRKTRAFARTVRNGLRLMWTLAEGDPTVLFELFPGLRASLQAPAPGGGGEDVKSEIRRLQDLILAHSTAIPSPPANYPVMKPAGQPPAAIQAIAAPVDAGAIADDFLAFLQ